jgi:hypothetical protein
VIIPLAFYTAYNYAVNSKEDLLYSPRFWFISGILLNASLLSFIQVLQSNNYGRSLGYIFEPAILIINTITYIIFIKGILCLKPKMNYSGS